MTRPRISVVMIAKNEELRIGAALASLTTLGPLLHEVCVYDTGSEDDTVAIARAHHARVELGYWDDDFARARNAAAAMASGDWLLVLDADEQLVCDAAELEALLIQQTAPPDGFQIAAFVDRSQLSGERTWLSPRLYRPTSLRYSRPVHAALVRIDGEDPHLATLPESAIHLINGGFDPARMQESLALKERLTSQLLARLPETSYDFVALTDRGRARAGIGRHDEALADLLEAERLSRDKATTYAAWTKELLVLQLLHAERIEEAAQVVERLELMWPGRAYTQWLRAQILTARGDHAGAFTLYASLNGAIDAGLSPLQTSRIYRACLDAAVEEESVPHIIAGLIAMVSLKEFARDYAPLMARWWADLPVAPLRQALAISADRSVDDIARELLELGGASAALGARLIEGTSPRQISHAAIPATLIS